MFGQRLAKGVGAYATRLPIMQTTDDLLCNGTIANLMVLVLWIGCAYYSGRRFERTQKRVYEKVVDDSEKVKTE